MALTIGKSVTDGNLQRSGLHRAECLNIRLFWGFPYTSTSLMKRTTQWKEHLGRMNPQGKELHPGRAQLRDERRRTVVSPLFFHPRSLVLVRFVLLLGVLVCVGSFWIKTGAFCLISASLLFSSIRVNMTDNASCWIGICAKKRVLLFGSKGKTPRSVDRQETTWSILAPNLNLLDSCYGGAFFFLANVLYMGCPYPIKKPWSVRTPDDSIDILWLDTHGPGCICCDISCPSCWIDRRSVCPVECG